MLRLLKVTAFFVCVTILMTWPLVLQMDTTVIGWVGDNYVFIWMIGWFQKSLVEQISPLHVPLLNYPEGYNLAYTDLPFTQLVIALLGSLPVNATFGYNLSLMVSFVLSGLGMFIWVRKLTDCSWAGIVAGTIFAFCPYRMSHILGHLNLMGTQWFPFYFMGITDLLADQKGSWKRASLPAIMLGLIAFTSQYYLYMTLITSILYGVGYGLLIKESARSLHNATFWKRIGLFGAIAMPLVTLSLLPYLQLDLQDSVQHSLDEVRIWSASPTDFILPSPQHFLWGGWVEQQFDRRLWIENTLYIGVIPMILAVIAWRQYKNHPHYAGVVKFFTGISLAVFILALGTDFHWLGQPVTVNLPTLIQSWFPRQQSFIPLPGYFLFQWLPFYDKMRVWMRYGIFVTLFSSVLAGMGAAGFLTWAKRALLPVPLIAVAILLLIVIDFYPRTPPISTVTYRPVDHWLRSQKAGGVAHFPFAEAKNPQNALATLITNKPYIADPFGTFNTLQYRQIAPTLEDFPNQASIHVLKQSQIRWVIVDSSQYPDFAPIHKRILSLGLNFAGTFETQYAYELQ